MSIYIFLQTMAGLFGEMKGEVGSNIYVQLIAFVFLKTFRREKN